MGGGVGIAGEPAGFASHFAHPGVRYVPIADLPPAETALVSRRRGVSAALRALIRVSRASLGPGGQPRPRF